MIILNNFKATALQTLPERLLDFLPHLLSAVIVVIVGFWISNLLGKLLVNILTRHEVDSSIHRFLQRFTVVLLKITVAVIALEQLGISVNSFITAIGAAGITAGLGLQNSIAQFAAGTQILFNKPFKSGDYIEICDVSGRVREIRFMYTTLITNDNKEVTVPNLNITTNNLINYTSRGIIRLDLPYGISYDDDIEKAKAVILDTAGKNRFVLKDPAAKACVSEHGDSGVFLTAFVWCASDDYWNCYFSMQEEVKLAFDANGITIPFNQTDVHIRRDSDLD